jgi:hypothetical protein
VLQDAIQLITDMRAAKASAGEGQRTKAASPVLKIKDEEEDSATWSALFEGSVHRDGLFSCKSMLCIEIEWNSTKIICLGAGARCFFAHTPWINGDLDHFLHYEDKSMFLEVVAQVEAQEAQATQKLHASAKLAGKKSDSKRMRLLRYHWTKIDVEGIGDVGARVLSSEYVSLELQVLLLPCRTSGAKRRALVLAPLVTALEANDDDSAPSVPWRLDAASQAEACKSPQTEEADARRHGTSKPSSGLEQPGAHLQQAAQGGLRGAAGGGGREGGGSSCRDASNEDASTSPSETRDEELSRSAGLITLMRQASGIYEWDHRGGGEGSFLTPGRVRVMTNGSLSARNSHEVGVLKRMVKGMHDLSVEAVTDLIYRYLQLHVFLALDADGVPLIRIHSRFRLPGNFFTTWKLAYQLHLDDRLVKFINLSKHVDVYTLCTLRLTSQPPKASGGGSKRKRKAAEREEAAGERDEAETEEMDTEDRETMRDGVLVFDQLRMTPVTPDFQVCIRLCMCMCERAYPVSPNRQVCVCCVCMFLFLLLSVGLYACLFVVACYISVDLRATVPKFDAI